MDLKSLKDYLASLGLPDFRFRQITKNYFSGRYQSFESMTDLPLNLRQDLDQKFSLLSVKESKILTAPDSQKALLTLSDSLQIESVLMDYGDWLTVCVSSQVGCPLNCSFCATGKMGFKRNLTAEEITDQIIYWNVKLFPKYIGRVVFMGMGEPFLNWENLLLALDSIKNNLKIGNRKISISTAGIADKIVEFANLDTEINLAVSLHSAVQNVRETIMPVGKKYPLPELVKALNYYTQKTKRQVFFEYALMADINDGQSDIAALIKLIRSNYLFYLNLIPLNPVSGGLKPSSKISLIEKQLITANVDYSLRRSLGQSISSACGQLAVLS